MANFEAPNVRVEDTDDDGLIVRVLANNRSVALQRVEFWDVRNMDKETSVQDKPVRVGGSGLIKEYFYRVNIIEN